MRNVRRGRDAGASQLTALIENPSKLQREVLGQMKALEEQRLKLQPLVRKYGSVQNIQRLEAEAAAVLETAHKKADEITSSAGQQFAQREQNIQRREEAARAEEGRLASAQDTLSSDTAKQREGAAAVRQEADVLLEQAKKTSADADSRQVREQRKLDEANALLAKLRAAQKIVDGALAPFGK